MGFLITWDVLNIDPKNHLQDLQDHLQDLQEHLQDLFQGGFKGF